jgi:large subunit ribosomal protein L6
MSRVGKQPIAVPGGIDVSIKDRTVTVKGPKGELSFEFSPLVEVKQDNNEVVVTRVNETKEARAMHGTVRSIIDNMIIGVKDGYKKELEINGVGFRAQLQGKTVTMSLGYSHPIVFEVPDGIDVTVPEATRIVVEGCDKQMVGQVSARLRSFYPAEPYKGKGVKYKGEQIRRKAGKTVA